MNKKKVYGFEVKLNNEVICRAGFENENSIINCIISSIRRINDSKEELNISVGGLNSDTGQHVDWLTNELSLGDNISIEVISDKFDSPTTIREPEVINEMIIKSKIKYFHRLKEELKDHLKE